MSETDPLLPKGASAPEISGYGFSKASQVDHQNQSEVVDWDEDIDDIDNTPPSSTFEGYSPLRTLIILFTIVVGLAIFITLLMPGTPDVPGKKPGDDTLRISARVDKILSENPLIDGHNDLAIFIRFAYQNDIYNESFREVFEKGGMPAQVDLPRLKDGKVGGSFWSAFVLCPSNGSDFSDGNYVEGESLCFIIALIRTVSTTLSQLDLLKRLTASYPKIFSSPTLNSTTALAAFKNGGKLISPIGVEGLHQIGNSFSNLRLYYSLGVRYATLTWNCNNAFADAAITMTPSGEMTAGPAHWHGLSDRGKTIVKEMNRMGMLVDLSHVSKETMLDVLGANPEKFSGSVAPIVFSHSSAYALCPHPRNVPDDVLKLVKGTNSIVMVNFSPDFISCTPSHPKTGIPNFYPPNSTLHQVARHITHIGNLIGYDHVGLGSDFDGILSTPKGLEDVSKYPDLVAELLRMGVSDSDAAKVVGRNILRVWGHAEEVALKMQEEGVLPVQDHVPKMRW